MKAHALFMHKTYEKEKSEKRITISLYNLFIKHLGGGTGLQIICNILQAYAHFKIGTATMECHSQEL